MAEGYSEHMPVQDFQGILQLNVGGTVFCTTRDTVTQRDVDSMLGAMFSGRHHVHVDPKTGMIFIDRDGTHFRHILNWLRDATVPVVDMVLYTELYREAEYYQLRGLMTALTAELKRDTQDENLPELTRKEVIKCLQTPNAKFRGVNLSGEDLSKLDLAKVDFSYARLFGTFFSRANLQGALFREAMADGSNFLNASLRECHFEKASLRGAMLAGCSLQSANMQDVCLEKASLVEADLRSAHLQNADLSHANLSGANLEGANLKNATMTGTNLSGANLQRAYLRDVDLREANIADAKLGGANMQGAIRPPSWQP